MDARPCETLHYVVSKVIALTLIHPQTPQHMQPTAVQQLAGVGGFISVSHVLHVRTQNSSLVGSVIFSFSRETLDMSWMKRGWTHTWILKNASDSRSSAPHTSGACPPNAFLM